MVHDFFKLDIVQLMRYGRGFDDISGAPYGPAGILARPTCDEFFGKEQLRAREHEVS
jgi:hypothetical protein